MSSAVEATEKKLNRTLGSTVRVDPLFLEYQICKEFGYTPEQVRDMPDEDVYLLQQMILMEARVDKLRSNRAKQSQNP